MVSSRLFLSPILLLIIIIRTNDHATTLAQPQPAADLLNHFCSNDKGNYTTTDSYGTNLNHLLSSLPSTKGNGFGFYNSSYGGNTSSEAIYAIGLCKGNIETTSDCLQCLIASGSALMELCPNQKEAIIWYDNCMLRYSNRSIYGVMETQPTFDMWSTQSVPSSKFDMFFRNLTILLERLGIQAAADGSLKFAKDNATILNYGNGGLSSLTALVECTPDLSELQCRTCLLGAFEEFPECCDGKEGGRVLRPSCNFNYQLDQVDRTKTTIPESGSPSQSPGIAPSQSPWSSSPIPHLPDNPDKIHPKSRARRAAASNHRIARIVIPFAVVVSIGLMISVGIYMKVEKRRPQPIPGMQPNSFETMESLQFDCGDIRVATNNFSEANKLGDDEYGTVYRGSLSNDKSIAVRRLSINYVKEYMEIKKEVLLMAPKLQHPNLVELLGCALEENSERLLVYEHFPNATLDRIIFDRMQSRQWDWEMRYNIIVSIARGLLHLHDSHFVHGDINASNILIDAEMNPKISNFGMARFFAVDQTQGNINGIHLLNLMSSTYMAPEAIVGHSSAESDVYSFGALVVEIVSGQEISSLASEKLNDKDLILRFAWKNWAEGTIRNLIDPTLWTGSGIEVMERCIRIGLLCMQRTRTDRPTMSSVTQMLSHSSAIPLPNKFRHGSFGIIGTLNNVEGVSDPRSRAKVQPFIAKMRCSTTGIINKIRRK